MISLTPYQHNDALRLAPVLHPISRAELEGACLTEVCDLAAEIGHATTGWINGQILFIAATVPAEGQPNARGTVFLFAKGHDGVIAFGLRRWAEREKEKFPGVTFWTTSGGDHPMKHRFLAVAGCKHVDGDQFVALAE